MLNHYSVILNKTPPALINISAGANKEMTMGVDEQVKIMENQLSYLGGLMEKMQYMSTFFDPDPEFSKQARDIVRANICKSIG